MVVGVVPYLIKVIVFPTDAQTFLCIRDTCILWRGVPKEKVLERIHTRIDKHEGRIVLIYHWSRRHNLVSFALEVL